VFIEESLFKKKKWKDFILVGKSFIKGEDFYLKKKK
jgi:hypothetical protein